MEYINPYLYFTIAVVFLVVMQRVCVSKGIGVRSIQFISVVLLISAVVVLGLADKLDKDVVSALLGAMAGYLFGNISSFENKK